MKINEETLMSFLENPELIPQSIDALRPAIYSAASAGFSVYKDLVDNDDYFLSVAKYYRKKYLALVQAGFSESEAMQILLTTIGTAKDYAAKTGGVSIKY